jgi:soluble lytic murein transglycosylase-like protein
MGRAYLARLYRRYKNWPDAIAAYNWGASHVDNWIKTGRLTDKLSSALQPIRAEFFATAASATPSSPGGRADHWDLR